MTRVHGIGMAFQLQKKSFPIVVCSFALVFIVEQILRFWTVQLCPTPKTINSRLYCYFPFVSFNQNEFCFIVPCANCAFLPPSPVVCAHKNHENGTRSRHCNANANKIQNTEKLLFSGSSIEFWKLTLDFYISRFAVEIKWDELIHQPLSLQKKTLSSSTKTLDTNTIDIVSRIVITKIRGR